MPNDVFANGRNVSCKSGSSNVIASFPDVCFTPPTAPPTPPGIPIPYPITSMSSDTSGGSRTVKINKKEIMLKNKSKFKKCTGDQAGSAPKKGLINSNTGGKTYFASWSFDVLIEGENVVRHLDLTTSNHRSQPGNSSIPMINQEGMIVPPTDPVCDKTQDRLNNTELPERFSRIHEDRVTRGEVRTIKEAYGKTIPSTTLGTGRVVGGSGGAMTAHSRSHIGKKYGGDTFAKGITDPSKSQAQGCGKKAATGFAYDPDKLNHRHAEAKMIEDWAAKGMEGQLVLNISRPVCENCAALIKHVNCNKSGGDNCNKVLVCDSNQSPAAKERLTCD